MPRYILLILDADLLQFINHLGFGISHLIGTCLEWVMKNVDRTIEAKKDLLHRNKPSALQSGEPKLIWVTMCPWPPNVVEKQNFFGSVFKFNSILGDLIKQKHNHLFLQVHTNVSAPVNFTSGGYLNDRGKEAFWTSVDRQIKEFDYNKTELQPNDVTKDKQ